MSATLLKRPRLRDGRPDAPIKLVCLPHAGGGASSFTRWAQLFPPAISLVRVQLPGREDVASEPLLHRLDDVVAELLPDAVELLDAPVALYGHSMGALVAFELAHALSAAGSAPLYLFVSGRRAPHLPARKATIHELPDAEFAAALQHMGGLRGPVRPAFLRYALPIIRADLTVAEEFEHRPRPRLDCPITAFYADDDPIVDVDEVGAWMTHTRAAFEMHRFFSGGHLFNHRHRTALAAHMARAAHDAIAS